MKMREPGRTWPAWGNGTCPGSSSGGGWHPAISPLPPTASPFPHAAEGRIAVETVEGGGLYQVKEQPSAENDWTTVLRIDDGMTWQNSTELMIWAIPMK